jgi:hypothetical protein
MKDLSPTVIKIVPVLKAPYTGRPEHHWLRPIHLLNSSFAVSQPLAAYVVERCQSWVRRRLS